MQQDISQMLLHILGIIEYNESKEAYVQEFLGACMVTALTETLKTIPDNEKGELKNELNPQLSPENIEHLIKKFSHNEEYKRQLEKAVHAATAEFIQTVMPTLSESQKDSLQTYLSSLV